MKRLEKISSFVKAQISFHKTRAEMYGNTPRSKKHLETVSQLMELLEFLQNEEAKKQEPESNKPVQHSRPRQLRLSLTPLDLDGLPEDLIKELSVSNVDKTEFAIIDMIEQAGGVMSLDQILVALFKQTGEVHQRTTLTNRLYRMVKKETIHSVPGKKGVYSSKPMTEQELSDLLELNKMLD